MLSTIMKFGFRLFVLAVPFLSFVSSQCPNDLAVYDPNIRSSCQNGSKPQSTYPQAATASMLTTSIAYFIVPVDTNAVATAVEPYNLLPLPTTDTTLFPHGFPAGKFPVLVNVAYSNDIRMSALELPTPLMEGGITVPYVDRLADGKTPFSFSVRSYIGGVDGDTFTPYIPVIVGSLEGTTIFVATFDPDTAPYEEIATSPAEYIAQITDVLVPNPISGPEVAEQAVDVDFFTTNSSLYTDHTFHDFISLPLILTNDMCQRNPVYFNQTFTDPIYRNGTVILYSPGGAFPGVYPGTAGYSASGVQLGYNAESCASAAANTDPKALA